MLQLLRKKAAFTLIELLVVVIIVAVLAAVGIPLMAGQINRARGSEAEAGLGTIRTAMRAQFAEFGVYPTLSGGTLLSAANIGVKGPTTGTSHDGDLDGRFFEDNDYTVVASGGTGFCVQVTGDATGTAPRGSQATTISRAMNELGNLFNATNCSGTPVN